MSAAQTESSASSICICVRHMVSLYNERFSLPFIWKGIVADMLEKGLKGGGGQKKIRWHTLLSDGDKEMHADATVTTGNKGCGNVLLSVVR